MLLYMYACILVCMYACMLVYMYACGDKCDECPIVWTVIMQFILIISIDVD